MTTNLTIITDALQELGVVEEGETPTADQISTSLRKLNQMIESWAADDMDLGYFTQTDEDNTIPIPLWAEKGVTACLAVKLSSDFQTPVSPSLMKAELEGMATILRITLNSKIRNADMSHLPRGTNVTWDINTDEV